MSRLSVIKMRVCVTCFLSIVWNAPASVMLYANPLGFDVILRDQDVPDPDAAKIAIREMIQRQPAITDHLFHHRLAELFLESGEPRKAVEQAWQAIQRKPEELAHQELMAIAILSAGDATTALALFKKLYAKNPDNEGIQMNLAAAHFRSGAFAEALVLYDLILERDPSQFLIQYNKGVAHLMLNDFQAAGEALTAAQNLKPYNPAPYLVIARAHARSGNIEDAIAALVEVFKRSDRPGMNIYLAHPLFKDISYEGVKAEAQKNLNPFD